MNEHIKTGKEIQVEISDAVFYNPILSQIVIDLRTKKWVSLDWLKEQINDKQKDIDFGDSHMELGYKASLNFVLSLLEKKTDKVKP